MKERIIIDEDFWVKHFQEREIEFQEEDMCSGYKKEQVPETFEELKKVCSNSKIQNCYFAQDLFIKTKEPLTYYEHICVDGFLFREDGCIYAGYENDNVSNNRTPANMWNIIKNLIGG